MQAQKSLSKGIKKTGSLERKLNQFHSVGSSNNMNLSKENEKSF